jgi:tyrosine-protein phosphatase non-receptor type 14/21
MSSGGRKKHKFWNILGGNKNKHNSSSSSDKQKSATLGRDKEKNKKEREKEEALNKHRWSTGLPKLQPLPANVSKETLCQLLESKLNDSELFLEFERIPKRKENAKYDCALMPENQNKNYDPSFLPYDENRVRLTATRDNRFGYVNASHITVSFSLGLFRIIYLENPWEKNLEKFHKKIIVIQIQNAIFQ